MRLSIVVLLGSMFSAQPAEISGQVVDAQTGVPVARARVQASIFASGGQPTPLAILTDAAGSFTIKNLPEGTCQLVADKPGYLNSQVQLFVGAGASEPLPVSVRMIRQAAIEGSVVDEKGAGVPFAAIQLWRQAIIEGRRDFQNASGGQTDETGNFRLFGLAAGRYWLSVTVQQHSKTLAYLPTFYPDAIDIHSAQLIDLRPGQEEQVQLRLRPVPAHEIRGQIAPHGRYASVTLRPKNLDPFSNWLNAGWHWSEKAGAFKISGVPSGVYLLEVSTQRDDKRLRAHATITVGDKDIAGIALAPGDSPALTGTLTVEGQPATRPVAHISLRSRQGMFGVQLDADGGFRLNELSADTYRLDLVTNGSFYARSIRQGGRELLPDRLVTIGAEGSEPIEIVLSPLGAAIDGTVPLPDSDVPTARVVLLRRADKGLIPEREAYAGGAPAVVQNTSRRGRFTMQGLAPGDYVLFAWPYHAEIEYTNPEILRQYDGLGKPISVTEGAKLSVNLDRLLPKPEP